MLCHTCLYRVACKSVKLSPFDILQALLGMFISSEHERVRQTNQCVRLDSSLLPAFVVVDVALAAAHDVLPRSSHVHSATKSIRRTQTGHIRGTRALKCSSSESATGGLGNVIPVRYQPARRSIVGRFGRMPLLSGCRAQLNAAMSSSLERKSVAQHSASSRNSWRRSCAGRDDAVRRSFRVGLCSTTRPHIKQS